MAPSPSVLEFLWIEEKAAAAKLHQQRAFRFDTGGKNIAHFFCLVNRRGRQNPAWGLTFSRFGRKMEPI